MNQASNYASRTSQPWPSCSLPLHFHSFDSCPALLPLSWAPNVCVVLLPQPCPPNTVTPDQVTLPSVTTQLSPLLTSPTLCATKPGYGWEDNTAVPCPIGYWAAGGPYWQYEQPAGSWQLVASLGMPAQGHPAITATHSHHIADCCLVMVKLAIACQAY